MKTSKAVLIPLLFKPKIITIFLLLIIIFTSLNFNLRISPVIEVGAATTSDNVRDLYNTGWQFAETAAGTTSNTLDVPNEWQNIYGRYTDQHSRLPMRSNGIFLSPEEDRIYSVAYWDEGLQDLVSLDSSTGDIRGTADFTHGDLTGEAITANDDYIYYGFINGIKRLSRDTGRWSPFDNSDGPNFPQNYSLTLNNVGTTSGFDISPIVGLAATETEVFIADESQNKILVHDAETLNPIREWSMDRPEEMALDNNGYLWIVQNSDGVNSAKIIQFDLNGNIQQEISTIEKPNAITFGSDNRLYIGDQGVSKQIFVYDITSNTSNSFVKTIGEYEGTNGGATPGLMGANRFEDIMGLAVDSQDNVYVAHAYDGYNYLTFEKYDSNENRVFVKRTLDFLSTGDFDPSSDGLDLYTNYYHYKMDYTQEVSNEWSAYSRLNTECISNDEAGRRGISTWLREYQGNKYLFCTGQVGEFIGGIKLNSDGTRSEPMLTYTHHSTSTVSRDPEFASRLMNDKNSDGDFDDAGENVISPLNDESGYQSFGTFVDENAGLWRWDRNNNIYHIPVNSINASGGLIYDWEDLIKYPNPTDCSLLNGIIKRMSYDPILDEMFISGQNTSDTYDWQTSGGKICKYSNFKTNPIKEWEVQDPLGNGAKSFTVEGDYIFSVQLYTEPDPNSQYYQANQIFILDRKTGQSLTGTDPLYADTSIVGSMGWIDTTNGINAHKRKNGEYLVVTEEGLKGRNMIYRLFPSKLNSYAFIDKDSNGIFDGSDIKLQGVKVTAKNSVGEIKAETLTDINGDYTIYLPAGDTSLNYDIEFELPLNLQNTLEPTIISNANGDQTYSKIDSNGGVLNYTHFKSGSNDLTAGFSESVTDILLNDLSNVTCTGGKLILGNSVTCQADIPLNKSGNIKFEYQVGKDCIAIVDPAQSTISCDIITEDIGIFKTSVNVGVDKIEDLSTIQVVNSSTNTESTSKNIIEVINIDGSDSEDVWGQAEIAFSENYFGLDNVDNVSDLSANFKSLWDADNLYLYINVIDETKSYDGSKSFFNNDGVEVLIDKDNNKQALFDGVDDCKFGFSYSTTNLPIDLYNASGANCSISGIEYNMIDTADGYTVEIKLPKSSIGSSLSDFEDNDIVGMDIQINDADLGDRESFLTYHSEDSSLFNMPNLWGEMTLLPGTDAVLNIKTLLEGALINVDGTYSNQMRNDISQYNNSINNSYVDEIELEILDSNKNILEKIDLYIDVDGNLIDKTSLNNNIIPSSISVSDIYYFNIKHRNHIGIGTDTPIQIDLGQTTSIDFTTNNNTIFGNQKQLPDGRFVLFAGDVDNSNIRNSTDRNISINSSSSLFTYQNSDVNMDSIVNATDRNIVINNSSLIGWMN